MRAESSKASGVIGPTSLRSIVEMPPGGGDGMWEDDERRDAKWLMEVSVRAVPVERNGIPLEVVVGPPNGPTLLFVHGFGAGIDGYRTFIDALAIGHQVIAVSLSGFGRSGWAAPYSATDWIDDIEHVVRSVATEPTVVVAHSVGATYSFGAANRHPSSFRAVVSLDHVLDTDTLVREARSLTAWGSQMYDAIDRASGDAAILEPLLANVVGPDGVRNGDIIPPEELRELASLYAPNDPAVYDVVGPAGLEDLASEPSLQNLPGRFDGPVLFLDGDPAAGSHISPELEASNHDRCPWGRQIRLPGRDHGLGLRDDPEPVARAIRSFVDDLA